MIDAKGIAFHKNIQLLKPLGFNDYNALQMNSFAVLSDSGTISEESSIMNFPAITIRQAHERPEGMDEGVLIMTGLKRDRILQSIDIVVSQSSYKDRPIKIVSDYDVDNFSIKYIKLIVLLFCVINKAFLSISIIISSLFSIFNKL